MGLPILESEEAAADVLTGEQLEIDLATGIIVNKSRNLTYKAQPVPPFMQELVAGGGLIPYVMKRLSDCASRRRMHYLIVMTWLLLLL